MDIVVLDGHTENPGDLSWEGFSKFGSLTVYDRTDKSDEQEIISRIGTAEIVITNKTPLSAAILDACPSIKYIGLLSTGTDVADCAHARELNIPVTNVPSYSTDAVAQFTIALLLEICSGVGLHSQSVHEGSWERSVDFCYWEHPLIELSGHTLGIIGFGNIGRAVGRIARAMGMNVLASGSRETEEGRAIGEYVSLDELLAQSDVISLHCPLKPETKEIINAGSIAKMRDGVIILNTGRGGLVDEAALKEALDSGKVYAAGVDVVSKEPITPENPLLKARNCFITPHIAWAPRSCRQRVMDIAADNLRSYLKGELKNLVN
ncbi:MAG: D-2-hydroxyacid dehydrogenase [Oscillospiraceae bacterium]